MSNAEINPQEISRFQDVFSVMHNAERRLRDILKYEGEWEHLEGGEESAIEDLMGMCEDLNARCYDVLLKRSPGFAKLHGEEGGRNAKN